MAVKEDLTLLLEVNKKAIEISTEVAAQNEEIMRYLEDGTAHQKNIDIKLDRIINEKLDKILEQNEEISRNMFQMKVLYITGILALVAQIIQIFLHK